MLEIAPAELTIPALKKKDLAVSLQVTFIGPVTLVPMMFVTVSKLDPAVTDSASVTAEPPIVALPVIAADAHESTPEIVTEAQESALAAAVIAPDVTVRPAARVARPEL